MTATQRICSKTGLALTSGPVLSYRIARESYGPLAPRLREPHTDLTIQPRDNVGSWSRYDTVGRTIYTSQEQVVAFLEMLAPYRTTVSAERRAMQPIADAMEVPLDDLWRVMVSEWGEAGNMHARWIPSNFREGRELYALEFPQGWWIDITATETIAALHDLFGGSWPTSTGRSDELLTLSQLTGEDRVLTTAIASKLREGIELDDGTLPLGVEFISKHGRPSGATGRCWAYWMRDVDNGLDEPTTVKTSASIELDDPAFKAALSLCKIQSR